MGKKREIAYGARLDRELNELLQELRVIQGGILLLIGFLLVIAFSPGFALVTEFQKLTYFLTLIVTGLAAIVVVAPVVHHRLAFRKRDKENVVLRGSKQVLVSIALVALSILGIAVLISDFLYPWWVTVALTVAYCIVTGVLWLHMPLASLREAERRLRPVEEDVELIDEGGLEQAQ